MRLWGPLLLLLLFMMFTSAEIRVCGSSIRIDTAQVVRSENRRAKLGIEAERWARRWSRACKPLKKWSGEGLGMMGSSRSRRRWRIRCSESGAGLAAPVARCLLA